MTKKIVADIGKCIGAGNCVVAAPQLFTQGEDDGLVRVLKSSPGDAEMKGAELAVNSCPSLALSLVETED